MTERAPEELRRILQDIKVVLNWHAASLPKRVGGKRLCRECSMPYPCRTRLQLLGQAKTIRQNV